MASNLDHAAAEFMSSDYGKKLAKNKSGFEKIVNSADGQKVKNILEQGGLNEALKSGDMSALKNTLSGVLNTDAGARLMREISNMMEK